MSFPRRYFTISGGSGDLTAAPVAGTTTAGTAIQTANIEPGSLSCLFTVLAETNTLTLTGKFQVSDDSSTWYDLAGDAQNPANVVIATGTAGADTAVTRVLPVPPSALSWKWVRAAVVNGVATGASGDTYAFSFRCTRYSGF
ncbi:MAG TPA: hypothetical protein VL494_13665 [Steroidobacteraceae bacterium]|jgi:hypothetical protein|nr:hypothetical protein [Steroidobacteraceae bacterium]